MKNLLLTLYFIGFCSIFAKEQKTKFFRIEMETPIRSSVATDMNLYNAIDKMLYYPKYYNALPLSNKGASQASNLYTFQLDNKPKSMNRWLLEYYKIRKDFRFKNNLKDYNFLFGFSRDRKIIKVNSFYYGNVLSSHWENLSSKTLAGDSSSDSSKNKSGSNFIGLLNVEYKDIFFGIPFYESKTRFIIIPKIIKRKYRHELTQRTLSTPLSFFTLDGAGSFSSETLISTASMNYFGVSLESPESKDKYKLFLDYFITNSFSKGSYQKQTFESISVRKTFFGLNTRTVSIDGKSIGLEKGEFFVSGTKRAFGISYQKSSSLSFYLKKYEEVFEQFYQPKFGFEQVSLYGSRGSFSEDFIYPSSDTISEYIADLAIYKNKTQIKIDDYRFGVSYKL